MIVLENLTKTYGTQRALDGLTLSFREGAVTGLLGPNGAGKTTLVEMIEGIQKPDSGEIRILGRSWAHDEGHLRRVLGIALQETNFIDKLTVGETLDLFASFFGRGRDAAPRILELIRLTEKRRSYVMNLSHGMRQRLSLGIALINDPEVLILDMGMARGLTDYLENAPSPATAEADSR